MATIKIKLRNHSESENYITACIWHKECRFEKIVSEEQAHTSHQYFLTL